MNTLLKKVLDEAAKLAPEEQRELAVLILDELRSEKRWAKAFADSQDVLARLADEALAEARAGTTTPLDFERGEGSRGRRRGLGVLRSSAAGRPGASGSRVSALAG